MRLVLISDTHCQLSKMELPDGDLLIHAGDLTYQGNITEVAQESKALNKLISKYTRGIILTAGNHDLMAERNPQLFRDMMGDVKVLIHESAEIEGIKIFGSPYTPWFHNWAFNVDRAELNSYWDQIPTDTNILVTHGPPMGILDMTPRGEAVGCSDLYIKTQSLPDLSHHIFGHIHEGYGTKQVGKVTYINASSCNGQYKPLNKPIVINA